jgi:hypothetical protein
MQQVIRFRRALARSHLFAVLIPALSMVLYSALAAAAPPDEAEPVAEAVPGFFTPQWWTENLGMLVSADVLRMGLKLLLAVLLFIVGWLLAKLVAWMVFRLLCRTDLDNKLAAKLGVDMLLEGRPRKPGDEDALERGVARVVFWLLMALVVVGVLDYAGLEQAAGPIQRLVDTVIQALPLVGKAVLILLIAYAAGLILNKVVVRAFAVARVDERFAELDAQEPPSETEAEAQAKPKPFSETAGQVVFWLVMVLGLAGAFDALRIQAISVPLSNAINTLMGLLPALGVGALVGVGGYVLAKIARVIVTRTLETLRFDELVAKLHLGGLFGGSSPSKVVGWVVMALIIVQTVIAVFDQVGLVTLAGPMTAMMAQFWVVLPSIAISLLFVALGVIAGRLLRGIVQKALIGVGFDRLMARLGFGKIAEREDDLAKPSGLVAFVVQIVVLLLATVQALQNLRLDTWAGYVDAFLLFVVTRAAVALVIVGVGFAIGNYVRELIEARQRSERPASSIVPPTAEPVAPEPVWMAEFARYAVLVFAFSMAVHQLGVAEDFVLLSFGLLFGALCLAGALAFGLGSRDLAGELVRDRYRKVKRDTGREGSLFGSTVKPPSKPEL